MSAISASKLIVLMVLYLFLPLTALTYDAVRRRRRTYEVERMFAILYIDPAYRRVYDDENAGRYYLGAVVYASVVASLGLMLLFLGPELGVEEFPRVPFGTKRPRARTSRGSCNGGRGWWWGWRSSGPTCGSSSMSCGAMS